MIEISKEQWNLIENAYKGEWQDYYNVHPEWLGRKVVMSGIISKDPHELGKLLIEVVHFVIIQLSPFKALNQCIRKYSYALHT